MNGNKKWEWKSTPVFNSQIPFVLKQVFVRSLLLWIGCVGFVETNWAEPPITSNSWPRFLNSDFDGAAELSADGPSSLELLDWSASPRCVWSIKVGDGYGLGVAQDGAYYHFDADNAQERLSKIDINDGSLLWRQSNPLVYEDMYGYEVGPRCSPTIDGDQIFTLGVAGDLISRNLADGTEQWKVATNANYGVVQNFFGVGSSPLVFGEWVIAMVGGSPAADQAVAPGRLDRVSPNGSLIVAFDRRTGIERWRCGDDLASYSSPRIITIDGEEYLLILARNHLHIIDPREGKSIGRVNHRADMLESVNAMVPVVRGNRVLVSDCYDLGAAVHDVTINNEAGEKKAVFQTVWKDPEGRRREQAVRSHLSTPVLYQDNLFACSGRNAPDSDFRCVNFNTGNVAWTALSRRRTTASRVGNILLIQKERGRLHIAECKAEAYQELGVWILDEDAKDRPAIRSPCWSAPIVVGNYILVRGDQNLLCLEIPSEQDLKGPTQK